MKSKAARRAIASMRHNAFSLHDTALLRNRSGTPVHPKNDDRNEHFGSADQRGSVFANRVSPATEIRE